METIADFIGKSNFPWEVPACVCLELTGGWWWPVQAGCSPGCTGYVRNLPMPDAKQMQPPRPHQSQVLPLPELFSEKSS